MRNFEENNMLRNKTSVDGWNNLKYQIESINEQCVPLKKQGKRSEKKHLSKGLLEKQRTSELCGGYMRTRKDEDYTNYKEALRRQCWKYNFTGLLMVEDLTGYFSLVFTREDITFLLVPDNKFQVKSDYLEQLIVTPEMAAKKIKTMKIK